MAPLEAASRGRADRAVTNFCRRDDYDIAKGLTQVDRLNMFAALSAGRRASLYRTTRLIPNGSKR
jgi:hypothetical protein